MDDAKSEIVLYDLAGLNTIYDRRALTRRLVKGLGSVLELLLRGAGFRYLRDGWRFFLFLFPFFFLIAALALLVIAALPVFMTGVWALVWCLPLSAAGAAGLAYFARRMHLPLMMDLWALTVDVAQSRRQDVCGMLSAIADDAARRISQTEAEEVIVVGHSFGAVPAIMTLADPRIAEVLKKRPIGLLAAGSYFLAVAHHPAARALREAARHIIRSPLSWLEAQSHTDPINFFRTNPADALNVDTAKRPSIIEVRFKNQLTPESYAQIRGDFFRTHRQFVYGVEKRSHYCLFAIAGGPEHFADVTARRGLAPDWRGYDKELPKGSG